MKIIFEYLRIILVIPFLLIWGLCTIVIGMFHQEFLRRLLEHLIGTLNKNGESKQPALAIQLSKEKK